MTLQLLYSNFQSGISSIKYDFNFKKFILSTAFILPIITLFFDGTSTYLDKFFFQYSLPIHVKPFHFIILITTMLLCLINKKLYLDNISFILALSFILLLHAFFLNGISSKTIQQIIGLIIILIFTNNYAKVFKFTDLIDLYVIIAKSLSFILLTSYLIILIANKLELIVINEFDILVNYFFGKLTLKGFSSEPQVFCLIIMPALGYLLFNLKKNILSIVSISFCIILSNSATGIIILASIFFSYFSILPFFIKNIFFKILCIMFIPVLLIITSFYVSTHPELSIRVFDFLQIIFSISLPPIHVDHLSNTILLKNLFLSVFVLHDSFLFGSGLGNHWDSVEKYFHLIQYSDRWYDYRYFQDQDAGSMLIRLISEFGFLGIISILIIFYYIFKSHKYFEFKYLIPSVIFLINILIRNGNIISLEFSIFIIFLIISYINEKKNSNFSN